MNVRSLLLAVCIVLGGAAHAAVFHVTSGASSGSGTLRDAILSANATPGLDEIDVVGGITVLPTSPLPVITDSIKSTRTLIIDGSAAGAAADGLVFQSSENDVQDIAVSNFSGNGVVFRGSNRNVVTDLLVRSNGGNGVVFENCTDNQFDGARVVGSTRFLTASDIVGNGGYGILITGSGSARISISGTRIGLLGNQVLGNLKGGIRVQDATEVRITSEGSTERTVLMANGGNAIELVNVTKSSITQAAVGLNPFNRAPGGHSHGIVVEGGSENTVYATEITANTGDGLRLVNTRQNKINGVTSYQNGGDGIALLGSTDNTMDVYNSAAGNQGRGVFLGAGSNRNQVQGSFAGNAGAGIAFSDAADNLVGGDAYPARQSSTRDNDAGIVIAGAQATGNVVRSIYIGHSDLTGSPPYPVNKRAAVLIKDGASGNTIGTDTLRNDIWYRGGAGIVIESGSGNRVGKNVFYAEGGPPIDLGGDRFTENDPGDLDSGPNDRANYPTITVAYGFIGRIVEGELRSRPNTTYTIALYRYETQLLDESQSVRIFPDGSTTATTNAAGVAAFRLDVPSSGLAVDGQWYAATATDASGNTSEFGPAKRLGSGGGFRIETAERVNENAGSLLVGVRRVGAPDWTASIDYQTFDGQALAGNDFATTTGTMVFQPGETFKTFTIPIVKDTLAEGDETFKIGLRKPSPQMSSGFDATVTIVERLPSLSVADVTVNEGDRTSAVMMTIVSDTAVNQAVTVEYRTIAGSAREGEDFLARSGSATIAAGATRAVVAVPLAGDIAVEDDETFRFALSNPNGATIGRAEAVATIRNDDGVPVLSAADAEVTEGRYASIRFKRTKLNHKPTAVNFRIVPGTAGVRDVTAGEGSISFLAEETEKELLLETKNDSASEPRETFFLELFEAENAILERERIPVTIVDDGDTKIAAEVDDISVPEGDAGKAAAAFTARLSRPSETPLTFPYTIGGNTATTGSDFEAANGSITFAPGETEKSIPFTIVGDTTPEPSERVSLGIDGGFATCVIVNDDGPTLHVADGVGRNPTSEVTLDRPSNEAVTFAFDVHLGSVRRNEFQSVPSPGSGYIDKGGTRSSVALTMFPRENVPDETFTIVLREPSFAKLDRDEVQMTISHPRLAPPQPSLWVRDATVEEPAGGGAARAKFVLEMSPTYDGWVAVDVETTPGTASEADYLRTSQRVLFAPNERQRVVEVDVPQDGVAEPPEWFFLVLRNVTSNVTLGRDIAVATIYDPGKQPHRRRSSRH